MAREKSAAWNAGYDFGDSLAQLAGGNNRDVDIDAARIVATKFAGLEGYRDLGAGMEYVGGFIAGYRGDSADGSRPRAIEAGSAD